MLRKRGRHSKSRSKELQRHRRWVAAAGEELPF
jgi:hypothetical protein